MIEDDGPLGLTGLAVPLAGAVQATGDPFEPYRLVDSAGEPVLPVAVFLADLQACGRAAATQRSYSMALLRWFRFLWAVDVPWDQATRVEARDFVRWVPVAGKPVRRTGLAPGPGAAGVLDLYRGTRIRAAGRAVRGHGPGPAADHSDPQGIAGGPAAACLA